jgi:hypothetical protein
MKDIEKAKLVVRTVDSLNQALRSAGASYFSYKDMKSITLLDFICSVAAPNEIGFFLHIPEEDDFVNESIDKM